MTGVSATAHPNIALVKYWGKQAAENNLPAVPSLSITLDELQATTGVALATSDTFELDGVIRSGANQDKKLTRFLAFLREHFDVPPLHISSSNNFPTAAGLASSAAGFAALVTAINRLCELGLDKQACSGLARVGSASAARSILGGFVGLTAPEFTAEQVADASHWPLRVVVAITDTAQKSVSSTEGMAISASTSPYYSGWVESSAEDYTEALAAVAARDFLKLADVSEHSCLKMHAVMQSSRPALLYWNAASVSCLQAIRDMRRDGVDVFFTMDAGPQVKAICTPASAPHVAKALGEIAGVQRIEQVGLGKGAQIVE